MPSPQSRFGDCLPGTRKAGSVDTPTMAHTMTVFKPRSLAFALLLAALPTGFAFSAPVAARALARVAPMREQQAAGVGAAGMGSAAVGGRALAGRVGGGPPASAVGGGAQGSINPAGNGVAGDGDPALNAAGLRSVPADNGESALTTGGVIRGSAGVPPAPGSGAARRQVTGQAPPNWQAPKSARRRG